VEGTPFGRYRLIELLGRGGMGEVWRAQDTATNNRTVAIKLLPPHLASDETFVRRFRREADAAARLNNPHIIPIHNYGEIDGRLYVDMRLIEGHNLQTVLDEGPLDPSRAVRIIEQVAKALQAAHKIGLVHRDVKPSNILLDEDDFAYLIDFGIARGADETRLTSTGAMIGSWHYMAPERLRADEADARADIYALACVLYECLTGKRPFPGETLESQVAAHLTDPPPLPSTARPNVPAQFDAVIAKGMAKDPDKRYASTAEFAREARDAITVPIAPSAPAAAANPPADWAGAATVGLAPHDQPTTWEPPVPPEPATAATAGPTLLADGNPPTPPQSQAPPSDPALAAAPPDPAGGMYGTPPTPPPSDPALAAAPPDPGGGMYGTPPIPPSGTYGTPYPVFPGTPPRTTSGFHWGWVVIGVIALGVVALLAGVVIVGARLFSSVSSRSNPPSISMPTFSMPSFSIPSFSIPSFPTSSPDASAAPTTSTVPRGTTQVVTGSLQNKNYDCNDGSLIITGSTNSVVITGHCVKLDVEGIKNVVTVDSADNISASGISNEVTYHSGTPQISNEGLENTVKQG
jgi:serine/threonine protein kinase